MKTPTKLLSGFAVAAFVLASLAAFVLASPRAAYADGLDISFQHISGQNISADLDTMGVYASGSDIPEVYLPSSVRVSDIEYTVEGSVSEPAVQDCDVSVSERQGVLDLTVVSPRVDETGLSYWRVGFAPDGDGTGAAVDIYQDTHSLDAVPSLFISTSVPLSAMDADKELRAQGGSIALISSSDAVEYSGELKEMKSRGNSTWKRDKKPYQIKLAKKASLIEGAGKAKTWILLAQSYDSSFMRTTVSGMLAEAAGLSHAPRTRPVTLYVNGEYRGLYLIAEKVQVDKARIDIRDLEDEHEALKPSEDFDESQVEPTVLKDTAGTRFNYLSSVSYVDVPHPEDVSGGYLIEMEITSRVSEEASWFITKRGTAFVVKSPEYASADEMEVISRKVQDLEDAIYASDGKDSNGRPLSELVALDELAAYYAVQELCSNHDAFKSSTYFYTDGGKLHADVLWDCDRSFGSTQLDLTYFEDSQEITVADPNRQLPAIPKWIRPLLDHAEFDALVRDAYVSLGQAVDDIVNVKIPEMSNELSYAASVDKKMWKNMYAADARKGNISAPGDFNRSVSIVSTFLASRYPALMDKIGMPTTDGKASFTRLGGATRYDTMTKIVDTAFPEGSQTAIVVCGTNYPDAVTSSSLAGLTDAPILITANNKLTRKNSNELKRLGCRSVIIVGGTAVVNSKVEKSIRNLGISNIRRISGSTRYATCTAVYRAGVDYGAWSKTCIVTNGEGFADALSMAPYAYAAKAPFFYAKKGFLTQDEVNCIKAGGFENVLVLGGDAVVNYQGVINQLGAGFKYQRLAGTSRYATSAAIVEWACGTMYSAAFQPEPQARLSREGLMLSNGEGYADALCGSVLCGKNRSAMLMVSANVTTRSNARQYSQRYANAIGNGYVVGGPLAVKSEVISWFGYEK